jgi:hypothetical protein
VFLLLTIDWAITEVFAHIWAKRTPRFSLSMYALYEKLGYVPTNFLMRK